MRHSRYKTLKVLMLVLSSLSLAGCGGGGGGTEVTTIGKAQVIAHRGSSYNAPENTLAAFNLAWEEGADMVELDLQLSKDNRIMVLHDATTGRTAGVDLVVKDATSDELRTLDVGSYKGGDYVGERIPFLEEALATIPAGKKMFVEIKTGAEIVPFLQQVLVNSGKENQVIVYATGAAELPVLRQMKRAMPNLKLYYSVPEVENEEDLVATAISYGLNGLSVYYPYATTSLVTLAESRQLKVLAWTVDDVQTAKTLIERGVTGILTDRPDLMLSRMR